MIVVKCPSEACTATARGSVSVPGAARVYRLKSVTRRIAKGGKARLKLQLPKKAFKVIKRALRRKKNKVRVRVRVTVRDAAGNRTTRKRTIRLKRSARTRNGG